MQEPARRAVPETSAPPTTSALPTTSETGRPALSDTVALQKTPEPAARAVENRPAPKQPVQAAPRHERGKRQEAPLARHGRPRGKTEPAKAARVPQRPRPSRLSTLVTILWRIVWLAAVAAGFVAVALPWAGAEPPEIVPLAGAVALTTLFTHGLAVRTGGRPLLSGGLALVLAGAAAVLQTPVLLAGAAVGTAVVTAVLAVMATTPAAGFAAVIREVSVAALVGVVGAFGVRAYGAEVSLERTAYLAIGFSLLGAITLVYRLGAGLQGLGRRGFVMLVSGVGLLTVTLAYTEALARWGSPALIASIDGTFETLRDVAGAVPRPIEVLLGFPALAWGVSTRARRRQGWWVCAFGAAGLAVLAVSLLDPGTTLLEEALSVTYSLVLGLLVGYLVIRADLYLTGARGRRARQLEELAAHRPEPGRFQPLL